MKWIELNHKQLPNKEVLAANFKKGTYGYKEKILGYLYNDNKDNMIKCDSDVEILKNCTHYIDLNLYDL